MSYEHYKLQDIVEITSSKRIHLADYVKAGIPFYRSKEVIERANGNNVSTELYITHQQYNEIKRKHGSPQKNDILLTSVGTLGKAFLVEDGDEFYFKDGNLTWFRNYDQKVLPDYIFYWIKSPITQQKLDEISIGSTQKALTISGLKSLQIALPSIKQQKKIVSIIKNIDHKINNLRKTNKILESIAQAIFKSWFVNFEPVHAKQQGVECAGIDKATADLFPNSFVESELGLIPKDWKVASIKDICEVITNGGTPSRSNALFWENGTIPWYKTGELTDSFLINHSENITQLGLEKSSVKLMEKDSVLMAIYAAPTVGRLGILTQASTFNQATTGMKAKQEIGFVFLYLTLLFGRAWFNNRANGAAQQNISKAIVESYKLVLPSANILTSFNNSLMPIFKKIEQNINQIHSLSNLRDTLLPRLISGKLDLSNIEEQIEGVA